MYKSDDLFSEEVERIVKIFLSIVKEKKVKIFSHFDADGISSATIFSKMLIRMNKFFELRFLKQLTTKDIENMEVSDRELLVFIDFGSGQLKKMKNILDKTHVLVLDHHEIDEQEHMNLFHLNPLLFNEEELSSSIICYMFAKSIDMKNADLIDLAVIGAIADEQDERWEIKGSARKIFEEAELMGKITILKGLRFYGRNTRPIHKTLEYSFDPFIPGISGSESNSIQFLSELGISIKNKGDWRKLKDLTFEEQQKLASAIIIERLKQQDLEASDIFGEIYTILGRPEETQDAREIATLINACGRLGRIDVAMRICMNDMKAVNDSFTILEDYKKSLSDALNWLRENKASLKETDVANFVVAGSKIPDTIVGTVTSMIVNSDFFSSKKPTFGLAFSDENLLKVSARIPRDAKRVNLRKVIVDVVKKIGGEGGGHSQAAGALIHRDKEQEFIKIAEEVLREAYGSEKD